MKSAASVVFPAASPETLTENKARPDQEPPSAPNASNARRLGRGQGVSNKK